jgi:UDP-3-O-[3-hydroxymyristoyl] N-acetylglucosamine deacetylase
VTPGLLGQRPRQTLAYSTSVFEGVGLHSGADASVCVLPAAFGTGRVFRDVATGQEIEALAANSEESARCTVLQGPQFAVQTVEHLLSAMSALGIDDAIIETRGGEIPAADGSAAPFAALLQGAGVQVQPGARPVETLCLDRPVLVTGEGGILLVAVPASGFRATVILEYPQPWIGTQALEFDASSEDYDSVASARTFGFVQELQWLRDHGLALGATHENALALGSDGYVGIPRMPDELVRHKLLDLIGDLALVGAPIQAHVIAVKPSHAYNLRLARALLSTQTSGAVPAASDFAA